MRFKKKFKNDFNNSFIFDDNKIDVKSHIVFEKHNITTINKRYKIIPPCVLGVLTLSFVVFVSVSLFNMPRNISASADQTASLEMTLPENTYASGLETLNSTISEHTTDNVTTNATLPIDSTFVTEPAITYFTLINCYYYNVELDSIDYSNSIEAISFFNKQLNAYIIDIIIDDGKELVEFKDGENAISYEKLVNNSTTYYKLSLSAPTTIEAIIN